jgi:NitT/TauT family transport system substrate-binding protein
MIQRLAIAIAALIWSLAPAAAQPATVSFGSVGGMTDAGLYLADELGYFKAAGIAVDMRVISTAPALAAAVATSQLDVGGISITPALFASVMQGIELRIVGDKQSVRPGVSATRVIARAELVKSVEADTVRGLKGKTVAVSAKGAMTYYFLARLLAKHGLAPADVRIAEISYPDMVLAIKSGAIDASVPIEPFLTQSLQGGATKQVSDLTEFVGGKSVSTVGIVYSEKFRQNRKLGDAFMLAYMRGVRAYNDAFVKGKDRDRAIDIIARHTRLDPKIVRECFPAGLDPNQTVDIAALNQVAAFYDAQHMLAKPIDAAKIVDTSFAEDAIKVLGVYK